MNNKNGNLLENKEKIEKIVHLLASEVSHLDTSEHNHGLLSGIAGHLLFLYQAHQWNADWVDEAVFTQKLEQLQEGLAEQTFELSYGLAGQAWLLEYLNQADKEDYDAELLEDVDQLFCNALAHDPWPGEIESVLGLAGYSPYAARRALYSDQAELWKVIVRGLGSVASRLDNGHITWSQPSNSVYRLNKEVADEPEYNLGLAHGVPGIIAALLPALAIDELKAQVGELLQGSCDWLLAQQNADTESSCYGTCVPSEHHDSRLGWCYGDLTIALTLARVGKAIDRPSYVEKALEIALHTTKRDAKAGQINDAGLCHGFAGMVTIYQLLNQVMPHPELASAMQTWLDYTLEQFEQRGIEAMYCFDGREKKYVVDFGFLMGYSGIGMALLGVLNDDTSWTDCLLMA
ncbi:lanthionine synthetase C family protein [Pseudoalteromonas sp. S16_S37]|uniref:lanthionine synthetase C family protein n=1 Tax=Pseudoalteromonas sp. S16_S37 TaxID=2720228 RepID=UPI001680FD66|nr:lanthionine synthetase C family protein [Pseudoalteromonas sp. S16_S37]MBD1583276.1 lanthionine synthetase C family protein [Pseudoalteromonas sp. S16_S37]